jgi:hypothetical protein
VIVDTLLGAFQTVVLWAVSGLPSAGDAGPFAGWNLVISNLGAMNYFLPIAELFAFVIGISVVFPALAGVTLLVWLVTFLRGGSARA